MTQRITPIVEADKRYDAEELRLQILAMKLFPYIPHRRIGRYRLETSMGQKDEILGRFFGAWYFALLGTRTGQMGFVWIKQGTGYARSQAA